MVPWPAHLAKPQWLYLSVLCNQRRLACAVLFSVDFYYSAFRELLLERQMSRQRLYRFITFYTESLVFLLLLLQLYIDSDTIYNSSECFQFVSRVLRAIVRPAFGHFHDDSEWKASTREREPSLWVWYNSKKRINATLESKKDSPEKRSISSNCFIAWNRGPGTFRIQMKLNSVARSVVAVVTVVVAAIAVAAIVLWQMFQ